MEHNQSSGAINYRAGLHQPQAARHIQSCRQESHQGDLWSRYRACIFEPTLFILVEGQIDMSCVRLNISYQVKITGAKKGLVHVSQNIPTKSALSVSLTRPEDVIIQVHHSQHTIVISSYSKIQGTHSIGYGLSVSSSNLSSPSTKI